MMKIPKRAAVKAFFKSWLLRLPLRPLFVFLRGRVRLPSWAYFYLRFRGEFEVPIGERSFRLMSCGESVENSIFWSGLTGDYEGASLELWSRLVRLARVVFDVGANSGVYSLVAKTVNPAAEVFAFEPIQRMYDTLQKNAALNAFDIRAVKCAVSNRDGEAIMYDVINDASYSSSLNFSFVKGKARGVIQTTVPVVRLDSFIHSQGLQPPDLLKIDVETLEPEVLEGLGDVLKNVKPAMLIEILTDEIAQKVWAIISSLDYQVFEIDDETRKITHRPVLRSGSSRNVLLCTQQTAGEIGIV